MSTQPFFSILVRLVLDVMHILYLLTESLKCILNVIIPFIVPSKSVEKKLAFFYSGKTVLITGASSGLGEQIALQLAKLSALSASNKPESATTVSTHLVLSARNVSELTRVAANCKAICPTCKVVVLPLDLEKTCALNSREHLPTSGTSDTDYMTAYTILLQDALKCNNLEGIDVLINNAGVSSRGSAQSTDFAALQKVMQINFFGPVQFTKSILNLMISRGKGGNIGVISSVQGRLGIPQRTSYAASKHAIQGYFDSLRGEMRPYNIPITVISPGYINTSLSQNAVTGSGATYGITDATTANGMDPAIAAQECLYSISCGMTDCILADAKVVAAIQAKAQFPALLSKMTSSSK